MAFRDDWKNITRRIQFNNFKRYQSKIDVSVGTIRRLANNDAISGDERREKRLKDAMYVAGKNRRKFRKAAEKLGLSVVKLIKPLRGIEPGTKVQIAEYLEHTNPYKIMQGHPDWKENGLGKQVSDAVLLRNLANFGAKTALFLATGAVVIAMGVHVAMPLQPPVVDTGVKPFSGLVDPQQTKPAKEPTKDIIGRQQEEKKEQMPTVAEVAVSSLVFCETSGNMAAVASNFDGMGISVGFYQANIGAGTLQKNIRKFFNENPDSARAIFGDDKYEIMLDVFCSGKALEQMATNEEKQAVIDEQIKWAKSIHGENKQLDPGWKKCFEAMAEHSAYRVIEFNDMNNFWLPKAYNLCESFGLETDRGLTFALSVVVNSGSVSSKARQHMQDQSGLTMDEIKALPEGEKMQMILDAQLATQIGSGWRESYGRRHQSIIDGGGEVHSGVFVNFDFTDRPFTPGEKMPNNADWVPAPVVIQATRATVPGGRN